MAVFIGGWSDFKCFLLDISNLHKFSVHVLRANAINLLENVNWFDNGFRSNFFGRVSVHSYVLTDFPRFDLLMKASNLIKILKRHKIASLLGKVEAFFNFSRLLMIF